MRGCTNCINTVGSFALSKKKNNDYRTPSSSSQTRIRNRCILRVVHWKPECFLCCCCVLVLSYFFLNPTSSRSREVVVFYMSGHWRPCLSSIGLITLALGHALACAGRTLVYGGGSNGIMGVVSGAALSNGGKVVGVLPRAMVATDGEIKKVDSAKAFLDDVGREEVLCLSFLLCRIAWLKLWLFIRWKLYVIFFDQRNQYSLRKYIPSLSRFS